MTSPTRRTIVQHRRLLHPPQRCLTISRWPLPRAPARTLARTPARSRPPRARRTRTRTCTRTRACRSPTSPLNMSRRRWIRGVGSRQQPWGQTGTSSARSSAPSTSPSWPSSLFRRPRHPRALYRVLSRRAIALAYAPRSPRRASGLRVSVRRPCAPSRPHYHPYPRARSVSSVSLTCLAARALAHRLRAPSSRAILARRPRAPSSRAASQACQ